MASGDNPFAAHDNPFDSADANPFAVRTARRPLCLVLMHADRVRTANTASSDVSICNSADTLSSGGEGEGSVTCRRCRPER